MLARPVNLTANQAAHYYEKDDYYSRAADSQFACYWYGKGATALGLEGAIDSEAFKQLLTGYSPQGKRLQAKPIDPETHRAGTDYVFNAPKTISTQALVREDSRLIEAHDAAVQAALEVKESRYAQARVWNPDTQRQEKFYTGNLISAVWRHETNRNQEPHLHSHDVDLNATQAGGQWRAVANELAVKHQKLLGQVYQNNLAYQAWAIGYDLEPKANGQFELSGYPPDTLAAFSTRRQEIESQVARSGEPESVRAYQRAAVQTRSKKTVLSHEQRQDKWEATIAREQLAFLPLPAARDVDVAVVQDRAAGLVQQGIEQLAEQEGAFSWEQLSQQILETSLGQCPFEEIALAIAHSPDLVPFGEQLTTREQRDHLNNLEQLLGLNYAKDEIGETEQAGGVTETGASRDSSSSVGIRVGERLTATVPADRRLRERTDAIDHSLSQLDYSNSEAGIELESTASGTAAIYERAALDRVGNEVAAALESSCRYLREFAQLCDRLNQLVQHYRDRVKEKEKQLAEAVPQFGSTEWNRTAFVLDYASSRLQQTNQVWMENERFWAERNPETGVVQVGRKADERVIASGKPGQGLERWEITHTEVEFEDWHYLLDRQQQVNQPKVSEIRQPQPAPTRERGGFELE